MYYKIFKNPNEILHENRLELSKIVIPFSKIFKTDNLVFIYSGSEKIPFIERENDYKMIMTQEFSNLHL